MWTRTVPASDWLGTDLKPEKNMGRKKKKGNQLPLHKGVIKSTEVLYPVCKCLTEFWGRKHCNRAVNSYLWRISHSPGLKWPKVFLCKGENRWLLAFLSSCVLIFSRALFIWLGARNMGSLFTLHEQGWQNKIDFYQCYSCLWLLPWSLECWFLHLVEI